MISGCSCGGFLRVVVVESCLHFAVGDGLWAVVLIESSLDLMLLILEITHHRHFHSMALQSRVFQDIPKT